jgi:type IV pilus assembly protein PilM
MLRLRNAFARFSALSRIVIFYHYRMVEWSVVVCGLIAIVGLIAAVLFLTPPGVVTPEVGRGVKLDVTTLDALELLDISDRSIKIAEVTDEAYPRLRTVCWSPVTGDIIRRGVVVDVAAAAAVLEQSLQRCSPVSPQGKTAVVSIPETQSFLRVLDMPLVPDDEMNEAVQWAVRAHIPFDLDRVYIDWQVLPLHEASSSSRREVLVAAARRDVVDPLLAVLDQARINVVALELEAQAIVRSLLPRDALHLEGLLVVDLGATATNVIFFDRGAIRFTAEFEIGGDSLTQQLVQELHLLPSIAAEKKALVGVSGLAPEAQVAAILRASALHLVRQVEQAVRQLSTQLGERGEIRSILISGGSANLPGLTDIFHEIFGDVPVHTGNPWTNFTTNERWDGSLLSPADALHFTTAFGLALRAPE